MTNYTADEIQKMKTGEADEAQIKAEQAKAKHAEIVESMSAKDFLIARTREIIKVPIAMTSGGLKEIEIRARLSRAESAKFKSVLDMWNDALKGNDTSFDNAEEELAEFLEYITSDPTLDAEFWLSDELDNTIPIQIMDAYFLEPLKASRRVQLEKFRKE